MVLLTGAAGYLGSQIARELRKRAVPFRALVRDPARWLAESRSWKLETGAPGAADCEVEAGDVLDAEALRKALRDVRRVIHCAALVKMWVRDRREFWRVNVDGLKTLLEAAAEGGVERVVYTSSFIALGPSADANAGEGLCHRDRYSNEYEESKARALEWLRSEGFRQFPVLALLPGVIYGPGPRTEGNLLGRMIDQYVAGTFPGILGSGEQRWSLAFNGDVVAAHLAALERGAPGQEYVLGGDNRSLNEFFRVLSELSGVQRPVRHLPFAVGKVLSAVEMACAELWGRAPQLTPGVVEIFKRDWVYSSAKAVRELGYRVTPLEEGLRKTLEASRERTQEEG
jgi:farnesol dehydrogenase